MNHFHQLVVRRFIAISCYKNRSCPFHQLVVRRFIALLRKSYHLNTIWTAMLLLCCITLLACHASEKTATFSGKLIDLKGKPISGHIVTLFPVEMSDSGSAIYKPITTIATSPGFLTARTR